jgi:hypothetical protein
MQNSWVEVVQFRLRQWRQATAQCKGLVRC